MDKEEILAMKPGEELNRVVAEEVMGHTIVEDATFGSMELLLTDDGTVWSSILPYSEDMAFAEQVVDKLFVLGIDDVVCWADFGTGNYTEAEAICKNAVLNVRDRSVNGN